MTDTMTDARAGALVALARHTGDDSMSPADEIRIDELVAEAAAAAWYCALEPSRDCLTLKQGNAIAEVILDAHDAGEDVHAALATSSLFPRNDAWPAARAAARDLVRRYDEDLQDLTRREHAVLLSELACRIETVLADADTSTPGDALSSCDRSEVLFVLSPKGKHPLDASITSHRPWPDFAELTVTEDLVHALAALGYTLGDYRKASGNGHASERPRGKTRIGRPDFPRRPTPLCSLEAVREMVDNACSTNFLFVLYAMVPIAQLIDLDPGRPFTFSRAAVATWDPWNGTFHYAVSVPAVTVTPAMGTLVSPARWYSPDHICGFVHGYYTADIGQGGEGVEGRA